MTYPIVALIVPAEVFLAGALALAGFLTLFWVLRGAPIGLKVEGESAEAPGGGYRDRVVAGVVVGLLLILVGAYVALTRGILWSVPVFAVGFGLVLALIAVNRRYRHGSPTIRRTIDFSGAALNVALLAGILIVANVLAFRYGGRPIDCTREHAFTLSSLTVKQLKTLKKPVTFSVFFGRSERSLLSLQRVEQMLTQYKNVNPGMIKVERIDPFREVERFGALVKLAPDLAVVRDQGGGILIEYGEGEGADRQVIRSGDLFAFPKSRTFEDDTSKFVTSFHGEDAVTSALIRLREEKRARVAFTTGHGETPISTTDPRQPANGVWRARLNSTGFDVMDLDLATESIPADLALMVVVAPRSPFKPEEVAKIRVYMERGGTALVLTGNAGPTGLDPLLKSYNIEIGSGMAIDPQASHDLGISIETLYVPIQPPTTHAIIDSIARRAVLLPNAAPLKLLGLKEGSPANSRAVPTALLKSRPQAWAETDADSLRARHPQLEPSKDQRGPLIVGASIADRVAPGADPSEGKPRLVVIGSGACGDDAAVQFDPTNLDLLMNAVGWLHGRPESIGITPNSHESLTLNADPLVRTKLIFFPTIVALAIILAVGFLTYLSRRD